MAEKRLTKEIAEQFLSEPFGDLLEFTVIDDEAAVSLGNFEGEDH